MVKQYAIPIKEVAIDENRNKTFISHTLSYVVACFWDAIVRENILDANLSCM